METLWLELWLPENAGDQQLMSAPTQKQHSRRRQSMDRKGLASRGRPVPTKLRFVRGQVNIDANIGEPKNWSELVRNTQKALDNIVSYIEEFVTRTERYKDEDGRILFGGLGRGAVDGGSLAPAVVDELQTMGSTLSDEEWKNLHRV